MNGYHNRRCIIYFDFLNLDEKKFEILYGDILFLRPLRPSRPIRRAIVIYVNILNKKIINIMNSHYVCECGHTSIARGEQ